ncbi:multidrug efflux RND transporter permease subunit [Kamptonema cortianum]|nr:multidrug efflux RND transporter permease subunit [Oscillatoria laete-virens]MDK3157187.1 multidrug efflux RND transporter permease subunit [Kamptonema cortianum]MDL5054438.1 multidrug efflux RND transporter permease subunit [Oscillatoria laete-virens NRMC-F 0139]
MGPRFFIDRPIFASVVSIIIVLVGLLAATKLPIEQYPNIVPPSVSVSAVYPGASAETVATGVAAPIESQVSGVENLIYFSSANTSDGQMSLNAFFEIGADQSIAAVDLQNRISIAQPQLPQSVIQQGITVNKQSTAMLCVIAITSEDPRFDEVYLANYAIQQLVNPIKRVEGVGNAMVYGAFNYAMRLILDPVKMAKLKLTVSDIAQVIREQNADYPGGRIGASPAPDGTQMTMNVITQGRFTDVSEFENVIVRANPDGSNVRLKDVATIVMGAQSYDMTGRLNGKSIALIPVYLEPGANALQTMTLLEKQMDALKIAFPSGISYNIPYNTTIFVELSIHEVVHTLFEAMVLVFIVVFVFLQNWRATLIPCIAVPVSLIGTFAGLSALGFSINLLTLFAMVLAIGIVVDDAIVVVENVERIMDEEGLSAKEAAKKAMDEVSGALVAIVLVLCSVFVPVGFMGGLVGQMYKQFAITIAVSVVLSGIVALTLTPALCALLLQRAHHGPKKGFFGLFNRVFDRITGVYASMVGLLLRFWPVAVAVFLCVLGGLYLLMNKVPKGFIPSEDQGYFVTLIQLPDGASNERTLRVVKKVEEIYRNTPEIKYVLTFTGQNFAFNSRGANYATMFVILEDFEKRDMRTQNVGIVIRKTMKEVSQITEAFVVSFNAPPIQGMGTVGGFSMQVLNAAGYPYNEFVQMARDFVDKANQSPVISGASTIVRTTVPQVYMDVDRDKAKSLGLNIADVFNTLQTYFGSYYINDFFKYGQVYRVQAEGEMNYRDKPDDIKNIYVRSDKGQMIPISTVANYEITSGPDTVFNFNGYNSAQISGSPADGYSSGDALNALEELGNQELIPKGLSFAWSDTSYQEKKAGGQAGIILVFGMVMVFLVLAAQYESWSTPFAVMLAVPLGIFGAFLAIFLRGIENDVYFGIGMITLVGLAAKNAILIVEFANQLHKEGLSVMDASIQAARLRFRPILMTSFAFILGVVPLMIASGAGANSRHSIGTGVFGGMTSATVLAVFFVPLFFYLITTFTRREKSTASAAPDASGHSEQTPDESPGDTHEK